MLVLTPLLYYLPMTVLAAIIMTAVISMFDYKEIYFLWRVNKWDLLILATTFLSTLFVGIEKGILIGVGMSLLLMAFKISNAQLVIQENSRENASKISVIRMEESILFPNASLFKDSVCKIANQKETRVIVLDLTFCNSLDSAGIHALEEIIELAKLNEKKLVVSGVNTRVLNMMDSAEIISKIGAEYFYTSTMEAQNAADEIQIQIDNSDPDIIEPDITDPQTPLLQ